MGRRGAVETAATKPAALEMQGEAMAGEDGCRTPTGAECRIPEVGSCPPAPKKQRNGDDDGVSAFVARALKPRRNRKDQFVFAPTDLEAVFAAYCLPA